MASTLRQSYTTGDERAYQIRGNNWRAQTFTVADAHEIDQIDLYLSHTGAVTGTLTVGIYATSSDLPVTAGETALAEGTKAETSIAAGPAWVTITFATPYALTAGTKYAIVAKSDSAGDAFNYVGWRADGDGDATYSGGDTPYSTNAGVTWNASPGGADCLFKEYGEFSVAGVTPVDRTYTKQLIAIGNNEVWREATAGTMSEITDAKNDIDVTDVLNAAIAFQKMIIANGTNLKVLDFVNTKIVTADVNPAAADGPPDFGTIITGASGAKMIVDYITAIDGACTVYGKRTTTTTFVAGENVTGTNPSTSPYYGTAGAIDFDMTAVAEVAPEHWYDYTVYGADAANYGAMPDKVYQVCKYRGRIQLCGNPNLPHQWYQSRQLNIFDYLYVAGDAQSPVAGNDADCGEVGDIVKVAIPYSDDYLIYGCANELWVMSGDAAFGGELNPIDQTTGILGDRAWCWDDKVNLYMLCTAGLLRIPKGFGQVENLTRELWPDFVTDLAFDSSLHRITLAFNPEEFGIHIFKTTLADGTCSGWWYDLRTEGLFPDAIPTAMGIYSAFYYQTESPSYRKLLVGCADGYIKSFDKSELNDDGTKITSYVGFAPLALSTHSRKDGIIKNLDVITGIGDTDSNNVTCTVHVARTAAQVIKKLDDGDTAAMTKVFIAPNWTKSNLDRRSVRGQWGAIVLTNDTVDQSWSMERLIVDSKEVGRSI